MRKSLKLAAIVTLAGSVVWIQSPQAMDHGSPGSNAVNNVSAGVAAVSPTATEPTPAPPAKTATTSAGQPTSTMAMQADMNFNPSMYKTRTDCLNAAAAAHASLNSCQGVRK